LLFLSQLTPNVRGDLEKFQTMCELIPEDQVNELNTKIIPFKLKGEVVALRPIPYQNQKSKVAINEV